MKIIYLGLFVSLIANGAFAQFFTEITGTPFDGVEYSSIDFADIDNDSDQDVLIAGWISYNQPSLKIYINDGSGYFAPDSKTSFNEVNVVTSIAFSDIDNDNDQDVLITGWNNSDQSTTKLYTNDGYGNFTEDVNSVFDWVSVSSVAFADINNDDDDDVLIIGIDSSFQDVAKLYTNDGNGVFSQVDNAPFDGVHNSSIAFADIDNDNDQDVLITGGDIYESSTILYINDGNGNFTMADDAPFIGVYDSSIAFADIDGDGDQDVLIAGVYCSYCWWGNGEYVPSTNLYLNDGNGVFTEILETPFNAVRNGSIAFADIDNDKDLDVLITGYNDFGPPLAKLFSNDGIGNFELITGSPFSGVSNSSVAFADIDNDDDQDVLITGRENSNQVIAKLYANTAITTGTPEVSPLFKQVSIFPNPNQGQVNIDLGELNDVSVNVFNVGGALLYHEENIMGPAWQFELTSTPGLYILELRTKGEQQHFKLMKQ